MDIREIKDIREIVEGGPIDELTAEEYLKKGNFKAGKNHMKLNLHCKKKSLKKRRKES